MDTQAQRPEPLISLVLPAFNAGPRLTSTVRDAITLLAAWCHGDPRRAAEVLVVDDGSTDGSVAAAVHEGRNWADVTNEAVGLRLLTHTVNRGKGAALRTGMEAALAGPHGSRGVVAFTDGDGDIPVHHVLAYCNTLLETAGPVAVVGSKHGGHADVPPWRKLASVGFQTYARIALPTAVRDTQVGAKAFSAPWLSAALERTGQTGFLFDVELLAAAHRGGCTVVEAPVELSIDGHLSTIRPKTALVMAWQLLKLSVRTRRGRTLATVAPAGRPDARPVREQSDAPTNGADPRVAAQTATDAATAASLSTTGRN